MRNFIEILKKYVNYENFKSPKEVVLLPLFEKLQMEVKLTSDKLFRVNKYCQYSNLTTFNQPIQFNQLFLDCLVKFFDIHVDYIGLLVYLVLFNYKFWFIYILFIYTYIPFAYNIPAHPSLWTQFPKNNTKKYFLSASTGRGTFSNFYSFYSYPLPILRWSSYSPFHPSCFQREREREKSTWQGKKSQETEQKSVSRKKLLMHHLKVILILLL